MIQTKNRKHAYSLARDDSVVDGCTLAQIHTDNIARHTSRLKRAQV